MYHGEGMINHRYSEHYGMMPQKHLNPEKCKDKLILMYLEFGLKCNSAISIGKNSKNN